MMAASLSLESEPGRIATTLFDSKGRILLTMWAFKLMGNGTGRKSRDRASVIILPRSRPPMAANCLAISSCIHDATLGLGVFSTFKYDFSPELEFRTTSQG